MVLLFDGSFKATDTNLGFIIGAYDYPKQSCSPGSFSVVNASSLPGGRTGIAGKFYMGVGTKYFCPPSGSANQHNFAQKKLTNLPPDKEFWWGYSHMIDQVIPWEGFDMHGVSISDLNLATILSNSGIKITRGKTAIQVTANRTWTPVFSSYSAGVWHDWMFHVKLSKSTDGFLEVFHKLGTETEYVLIYSRYGWATEPAQAQEVYVRAGAYRDIGYTKPQTHYILNTLFVTTRDDFILISTPTPTPPPISTPTPDTVPLKISLNIESNPVGAKIIVNGVAVN